MRIMTYIGVFFALLITGTALGQEETAVREEVVVNEESGSEYRTGLELYNRAEYDAAIACFQKSFELDGRNINALFAHGLALGKLNRNAEATVLFEQVLSREPNHEKALRILPTVLVAAGDPEGAMKAYDRAIAALPGDYSFYFGKAVILLNSEDYTAAIPLLEKAVSCAPERIEILERLMYTYREAGDREAAFTTAQKILGVDDNQTYARLICADYYREMGQYREALRNYERAARDTETKAYADYYSRVIEQELEEMEIEEEYREMMERRRSGSER